MPSAQTIERQKKKVNKLDKIFKNDGVYLIDYRGLSVNEMEELRNRIKELNANMKVIKNRLAVKYFEKENKEFGREIFNGPIAVAYTNENFTELAKIIVNFAKENKKIKIKSGFIENVFVDKEKIKSIAKLPGRDQLMSQLVFLMAMPLKKVGMILSSPLKNILILFKNLKDKKEKEDNNG